MNNKLIIIGWLGFSRAYLNIPKEEAIARWIADGNETYTPEEVEEDFYEEFTFDDEFSVYSAWSTYDSI